jgi:pimeloyl-ACP methyl ester carboxylesterase
MIVGIKRALGFARSWEGGPKGILEEEAEIQRGDRPVPATLVRVGSSPIPNPAWVVLHGVTRPGRHHPVLIRFQRALAGTGAAVLVPEIPEWTELYLAPDEATATIRASVAYLEEKGLARPGRVGVMGFSLGVPQVLLSATDPVLRGRLAGVAGFGGYGDLDRTIHFLFRGEHEWEGRRHFLEPDPYGRWIVGGNYLTLVPGYEDAGDVAGALLALAKQAGDLQVGAWDARYDGIKEELLTGIHPTRRELFRAFAPPSGSSPPAELSQELVPALAQAARTAVPHSEPLTFLDRITTPVRLVHGRGDRLIPFSESLRLAEAFSDQADVRAHLTGLFAHSKEDDGAVGIEDRLNFLRILSDLLAMV